jgi:abortive infection bacteriophage resistance protein
VDKETTPVKVNILKVVDNAMRSAKYRLESLLVDYHKDVIKLSQAEYTALLEFRGAAATLELLFDDYFAQVEEHGVDTLYLPVPEFRLVLDLSKTVETSFRSSIAHTGIWAH